MWNKGQEEAEGRQGWTRGKGKVSDDEHGEGIGLRHLAEREGYAASACEDVLGMSSSKTLAEWRKRGKELETENAFLRQRVDRANACVLELAEKVERLERKTKPDDQTLTKSIV